MSLADANQLIVDELYEEAYAAYSAALEKEPSPAGFAGRAAASIAIQKYTSALRDATSALALDPDCEPAHYRKALACFSLDEFESALTAFQAGLKLAESSEKLVERRKYKMWIRKCEAELEEEDDDDDADADAAMDGASTSAHQAAAAPAAVLMPPAPPPSMPLATVAPSSIKYQYYQSPTHVTITVLARGVTKETSEVQINPKSLVVRVVREGFEMTVINGELYDPVVVDESSVKFLATKVEIRLKKKEPFNWNELLLGACIGDDPKKRATPPPRKLESSTTSTANPYTSRKDWTQLEKDLEDELNKEKPEGEEALNSLFQQIYGNATPETRRAMNKSFQTSGGTVLSTNWNEVGTTDYEKERQAPSGMEWKNWEGKKLPQKDSD